VLRHAANISPRQRHDSTQQIAPGTRHDSGFAMNRSIPKKDILIQCGPYFVRTIRMKDASERWAGWLSDTEAAHMLNSPAVTLTKDDVVKYIKSFDQRSHLLLGIFERSSSLHIGITRLDIDYGSGIALLNILIGEKDYRHKGVASTIAMPCIDYFFRNPNLNAIKANVLTRNSIVLQFMTAIGWKFDDAAPRQIRSAVDNSALDARTLILSREAWSAWRGQTSR
jgi:RimJ/RimL family protein N-acetyltransferase